MTLGLMCPDQELKLTMRQELGFLDPRLRYAELSPGTWELSGDADLIRLLWTPHVFLANEQRSSLLGAGPEHDSLVRVRPDGYVTFAIRFTVSVVCTMKVGRFPFDQQECPLLLESWLDDAEDLRLHWAGTYGDRLILDSFSLMGWTTDERLRARINISDPVEEYPEHFSEERSALEANRGLEHDADVHHPGGADGPLSARLVQQGERDLVRGLLHLHLRLSRRVRLCQHHLAPRAERGPQEGEHEAHPALHSGDAQAAAAPPAAPGALRAPPHLLAARPLQAARGGPGRRARQRPGTRAGAPLVLQHHTLGRATSLPAGVRVRVGRDAVRGRRRRRGRRHRVRGRAAGGPRGRGDVRPRGHPGGRGARQAAAAAAAGGGHAAPEPERQPGERAGAPRAGLQQQRLRPPHLRRAHARLHAHVRLRGGGLDRPAEPRVLPPRLPGLQRRLLDVRRLLVKGLMWK
ncbi:hypothetical protein FOCC_FOCC016942 [Frankliniella occidentalis]|nr:hypothetical protein FOCC_FOCC016942 [Frankliniella occidentalis]